MPTVDRKRAALAAKALWPSDCSTFIAAMARARRNPEKTILLRNRAIMFRNLSLAAIAAASSGVAGLAPTSALGPGWRPASAWVAGKTVGARAARGRRLVNGCYRSDRTPGRLRRGHCTGLFRALAGTNGVVPAAARIPGNKSQPCDLIPHQLARSYSKRCWNSPWIAESILFSSK
jgi:hypothetical protein